MKKPEGKRTAKRMTTKLYEKTAEDRREDRKRAKALGLSRYAYEHTAVDRAADAKAIRRINAKGRRRARMTDFDEPEDVAAGSTAETLSRVRSFLRAAPPHFVNMAFLLSDGETARLVLGQKIEEDFLPSAHIVLPIGALSALAEAAAKHLEKVAAGRMGMPMGSA